MHRPLRVPFYVRVWQLIRGIFLYNTVYWKRASDELEMPSLTPEERERQRPVRNLEIIRPRERPRARIERQHNLVNPEEGAEEGPLVSEPVLPVKPVPRIVSSSQQESLPEGENNPAFVKRRRRKRRQHYSSDRAEDGFLWRVFRKK